MQQQRSNPGESVSSVTFCALEWPCAQCSRGPARCRPEKRVFSPTRRFGLQPAYDPSPNFREGFETIFKRITVELKARYLLGYYATDQGLDGSFNHTDDRSQQT